MSLLNYKGNKIQLIGLAGRARAGKDTVADELIDQLGGAKHSFAGSLKAMIKAGLGLNDKADGEAIEKYGVNYRFIAQTLGTEWGRDTIHPDLWVLTLKNRLQYEDATLVIIPDVRFPNEAKFIREHGILIHVTRPGEPIAESLHASENKLAIGGDDYRIANEGTLAQLIDKVDRLVLSLNNQLSEQLIEEEKNRE